MKRWWQRLGDWLKLPPRRDALAVPPTDSAIPSEETYLRQLLLKATRGEVSAIGDPVVGAAIERMVASGRIPTALEVLRRLWSLRQDPAVGIRLAELLCDRLDYAAAQPFLEELVRVPKVEDRARFLLAETREQLGDREGARGDYERLLARDIDYPKARARAEPLRSPAREAAPIFPTLAGYLLERELGRGGAATVYLARDRALDRSVAIKWLHTRNSVEHHFAEARLMAAVAHPGLVTVFDCDEVRGWIAMEYCAGGSLRQHLRRGALSFERAQRAASMVASALQRLHSVGIVHRDVKPENLLYRSNGELVLADLGLARAAGEGGGTGGTRGYLAPEVRRGQWGPPADLYAFGRVLEELFPAPPPEVAALLAELLAEDPTARPTAVEVAKRLGPHLWYE